MCGIKPVSEENTEILLSELGRSLQAKDLTILIQRLLAEKEIQFRPLDLRTDIEVVPHPTVVTHHQGMYCIISL